jgi:hypothetical protein
LHLRTELCDWRQHGPLRVTGHFSKPNSESGSKGVSARILARPLSATHEN